MSTFVAAVALILAAEVAVNAPRFDAAAVVAASVWSILPGVVLVRNLFSAQPGSNILAWLLGPALGFGFSVFGMFLLWAVGLHNWAAIILGPALTWLLAAAASRVDLRLRLPAFDRHDVVAVT